VPTADAAPVAMIPDCRGSGRARCLRPFCEHPALTRRQAWRRPDGACSVTDETAVSDHPALHDHSPAYVSHDPETIALRCYRRLGPAASNDRPGDDPGDGSARGAVTMASPSRATGLMLALCSTGGLWACAAQTSELSSRSAANLCLFGCDPLALHREYFSDVLSKESMV